jgi:hypothetical protein
MKTTMNLIPMEHLFIKSKYFLFLDAFLKNLLTLLRAPAKEEPL